jgi:hypothetical protein
MSITKTYWKGTWKSTQGPEQIRGDIYAILSNETVETANVLISYTGGYMYGLKRNFVFTVEPKISLEKNMYTQKFSSITKQNITMETNERTSHNISGTYKTLSPGDEGTFKLTRSTSVIVSKVSFSDYTPFSVMMSSCIII